MAISPRWPRGGWTGTPVPPPSLSPYVKLVASAVLERTEDDNLKFLCFTASEPSVTAVANLPGGTPEAKTGYFVDYLEAGYDKGLTAWDLIGGPHDSAGLVLATPRKRPGEPRIEDPEGAVAFRFPESRYESSTRYLMEKALAENPNAAELRLALYRKRATGA
jgi:hypothetical protein